MASSEIKARDGTRIAYDLWAGSVDAPSMVLIHSLGMDRGFWCGVAEQLRDHASLLMYDCRGHGQSGKPKGPYTVERMADDLSDLLDHVGWPSAIVAGASMGGCITLAFAAAYPARAQALGLIDTTAYYGAPEAWEERAQRALRDGLPSMIVFQNSRWFTEEFCRRNPDILKRATDVFLANDPTAYAETCRMLGACNLTSSLPGLHMPAAIVVGDEDYATPVAMAETLHRGIPHSTLKILRGARHLTPLECPDRIAAELIGLTETTAVR